jgi:predicted transcriptional regulator
MSRRKVNLPEDPVVAELDAIKRLLALQLLRQGATQGDVALALQVDQSVVSRMFPARKISKPKSKA